MRPRFRALACAVALAVVALVDPDANAYVRGVSKEGYQLSWQSGCEVVTVYMNGFTEMTADEVAKSIGAAAAAWGPGAVTCPNATGDGGTGHPAFSIITQFATGGSAPAPANDGQNTVVFQTTPSVDLPGNALAYTTAQKDPSGHVVDVDIEINATPGRTFEWANLDPGVDATYHGIDLMDLQTVMTHEFGHFVGLAHTCDSGIQGDDDDEPKDTPMCGPTTPASDVAAVMYYEIASNSTKRTLTTDDERGVCAIYPPGTPSICAQNTPDDGCGCATSGGGSGTAGGLLLGILAAAAARRRTRRAR
jgi:MYXO-CTERM domain-containing protein